VRRAGRITRKTGNFLGDEFADLNITYGLADNAGSLRGDTFRLYRFNFTEMEYSSVFSEAVEDVIGNEEYLVEHPVNRDFRKPNGDSEDPNEMSVYSFKIKDSGNATWNVGDAYGYEFARIRLPDNYTFGGPDKYPRNDSDTIVPVKKVIKCLPDSTSESLETIEISSLRPSGRPESIGDTKKEMKDI
jgi:hypothetical protein